MKKFFNDFENSMIKTQEKRYKDLDIKLEAIENEVLHCLRLHEMVRGNIELVKFDNFIAFHVLDFSILVRGSENDFTVKAGTLSGTTVSGTTVALGTILLGPAVLAAKAAGMIYDTRKVKIFFNNLDDRLNLLALTNRSKPENINQNNIDADIPKKIEALAKLHQVGILTDEEFKDKKKELLSRL